MGVTVRPARGTTQRGHSSPLAPLKTEIGRLPRGVRQFRRPAASGLGAIGATLPDAETPSFVCPAGGPRGCTPWAVANAFHRDRRLPTRANKRRVPLVVNRSSVRLRQAAPLSIFGICGCGLSGRLLTRAINGCRERTPAPPRARVRHATPQDLVSLERPLCRSEARSKADHGLGPCHFRGSSRGKWRR